MNKIYLAVPVMSLLLSSVNYDIDTYTKSEKVTSTPKTLLNRNVISPISGDLADYPAEITMQNGEEEVFETFVKDIINNSHSMPADIASYVNDNFWDLI